MPTTTDVASLFLCGHHGIWEISGPSSVTSPSQLGFKAKQIAMFLGMLREMGHFLLLASGIGLETSKDLTRLALIPSEKRFARMLRFEGGCGDRVSPQVLMAHKKTRHPNRVEGKLSACGPGASSVPIFLPPNLPRRACRSNRGKPGSRSGTGPQAPISKPSTLEGKPRWAAFDSLTVHRRCRLLQQSGASGLPALPSIKLDCYKGIGDSLQALARAEQTGILGKP